MIARRSTFGAKPHSVSVAEPFSSHLIEPVRDRLFYALNVCGCLSHAKEIHVQILHHDLHRCSYLVSKFLRTLSRFNVPVEPYQRTVFGLVDRPNSFLHNALIRGYVNESNMDAAVNIYTHSRWEAMRPLSFTFSSLFKGCGQSRDANLGRQLHSQTVVIGGFSLDLVVNNAIMDMYVKCGSMDCAGVVFDEMTNRDVVSWTSLIVAYAKRGNMDSAKKLFDKLPGKDKVAWTAMVTGFSHNGKPHDAIEHFLMMQDAGVETDDIALLGFISACAQLGTTKYNNMIHDAITKCSSHDSLDVFVGSALIDLHSKSGNVGRAYEEFQRLRNKNVYSYSSMIHGFAVHGFAGEAFKLFQEMAEKDVKPNQVTLIGMLAACSYTGMWRQGLELFDAVERCSISPSLELYTSLVDMLGRAGLLKEALCVAKLMPEKGELWGALLNACNIHGDANIGEVAASHLFVIEPEAIGNYLLLCSTYHSAGRWEDVFRIRNIIEKKGLPKDLGYSSSETLEGLIFEFHGKD